MNGNLKVSIHRIRPEYCCPGRSIRHQLRSVQYIGWAHGSHFLASTRNQRIVILSTILRPFRPQVLVRPVDIPYQKRLTRRTHFRAFLFYFASRLFMFVTLLTFEQSMTVLTS